MNEFKISGEIIYKQVFGFKTVEYGGKIIGRNIYTCNFIVKTDEGTEIELVAYNKLALDMEKKLQKGKHIIAIGKITPPKYNPNFICEESTKLDVNKVIYVD